MTYYNLRTGRKVERSAPDPWLEASDGWERLWEPPVAESDNDPAPAGEEEI